MKTRLLLVALLASSGAFAQQPNRQLILECMACHGDDGIAKDKDVPHLAGQNFEYLLKQMRDFRAGRRPHKEMRVMSRLMDDEEMREIADFYARLPR